MERKKYLILTAGGSGRRMGSKTPKQFLEAGGKAILHVTLDRFMEAVPDISVLTVIPDEWRQTWKDYCYSRNVVYRQTLVPGGITRFHSVKNALAKVPDGALVAVHDGVRPLVSKDMIRRLFSIAVKYPAVVPVMPSTDTLKVLLRKEGPDGSACLERIPGETADRSRLYAAQTPQIFWSEVLKEAYSQPYSTSFTDDASVVESMEGLAADIIYPEGEKYNIKITTPDDMAVADALLKIM